MRLGVDSGFNDASKVASASARPARRRCAPGEFLPPQACVGARSAADAMATQAASSSLLPPPTPPAATAAAEVLPVPDRELCFEPSALTSGAAGDVATFIAELRQRAPLSLIRDDLRALIDAVHADLVACVQRDFAAFVALGPSIDEADALADAAAAPLAVLRTELTALVDALDADIGTLSETLGERRKVADRAEALRVLLRANDLLHKCERLLRDYAALDKGSGAALRLLERIAGECAQLSFALSRTGNGSFVRGIAVRVSVVRRSLRMTLEAWLRRALFPSPAPPADGSPYDCDVLRRVLDTYVVAGIAPDAEDFFRREIVAPFASERIRMTPMLAIAERESQARRGRALSASPTSASSTSPKVPSGVSVTAADALEVAERVVLQFLGERVTPLTSLCESEERLKTRFDFVGNAVWPQIAKAIAKHMHSAFSPGTPDVFHQSVLSGARLYAAVETSLISDAQVETLRKSPTTLEFWRHWNLPVYFQLRFQEITSKFDADLQRGPAAADPDTGKSSAGSRLLRSDMYRVQATVAMIDALRECWSERVYLEPLAHRFLRLSLQMLARYVTWVRTGLAGEWSKSESVPAGAARVYADVLVVQTRVPAEFASLMRLRHTGVPGDLLGEIDAMFETSVAALSALLPDLTRSMSDALSQACVDNLQPLRGILATYRMSSKPSPTTHSPFVPKVLRPLKSFLNEQRSSLRADVCLQVATAVSEATTAKYYEMATDLLSSNKKSEETLRRLNIGRGGAAMTAARTSTMTDKVSMQLYLDVAKFRDDIEALGVPLEGVPSVARLWECVRRDDGTGAAAPAAHAAPAPATTEPAPALDATPSAALSAGEGASTPGGDGDLV
jgi:conserved oligomeric Golgi complex subunit 2